MRTAMPADIISFSGAATSRHGQGRFSFLGSAATMDERVEFARVALGDRIGEVKLNIVAPAVALTTEWHATLNGLQHLAPSLSIEERADVPGLLVGTAPQIEQSSIPVDQDLLCGLLGSGGVVGAFDEFAVLELRAGADERHQMGRVDRPPA